MPLVRPWVAACLSVLFAACPAQATGLRAAPFVVAPRVPVGGTCLMLAAGDFDGDGHVDVAVTLSGDSLIHCFLGHGDGTFSAPVTTPVTGLGNSSLGLAAADLDGDGRTDLVAENSARTRAIVLHASGAGAFEVAGSFPFSVAVGTINELLLADATNDGLVDLAAVSSSGVHLRIARGLGGGAFAPSESLSVPSGANFVRVEDGDGDGVPDLFAVGGTAITRFLASGGRWGAPIAFPLSGKLGVADLNGDGLSDLVAVTPGFLGFRLAQPGGAYAALASVPSPGSNWGGETAPLEPGSREDLILGDGDSGSSWLTVIGLSPDGQSAIVRHLDCGGSPWPEGTGDVDEDGHADLVISPRDDHSFRVFYGGSSRPREGRVYDTPAASAPASLVVADLDRDGRADLAWVNSTNNVLTHFRGLSDGTLDFVEDDTTATYPVRLAVGDLNGDGWPDLGVAAADGPIASQSWFLNDGAGRLGSGHYLNTGSTSNFVAIGDVSGDGRNDLLFGDPSGFLALRGLADGTLAPPDTVPGLGDAVRAARDLDGDGVMDFVVGIGDTLRKAFSRVGSIEFGPPAVLPALVSDVTLGQLDLDGEWDAIVVQPGGVEVCLGAGRFAFAQPVFYAAGLPGCSPYSVAIGDVDGDGFNDLVTSSVGAQGVGSITVWYNRGDGTFTDRIDFPLPNLIGRVALGDVDGNGTLDLAVCDGQGHLGQWKGRGVSVFLNAFPSPPTAIAPTPTQDALTLSAPWPSPWRSGALHVALDAPRPGEAKIELIDIAGRVVGSTVRMIPAGRSTLSLDSRPRAPGVYMLRVTLDGRSAVGRVVAMS